MRSKRWPRAHGAMALPGYTHMQQAMPSTRRAVGAGIRRGNPRRCGGSCSSRSGASARIRLGSAAGYGTPNLDISREATRRRLGFAVTQEPVTAVQLSRGKAEAQLLFEITLLAQDLGRLAADLLLFYTQEFGFVTSAGGLHHRLLDHAAKAQSRCLRADARAQRRGAGGAQRGARHHAKADLGLSSRSAADQAAAVSRASIPACRRSRSCRARSTACAFGRKIFGWIPAFTPPPRRMRLVAEEGIPFREAYQRVAAKLKDSE